MNPFWIVLVIVVCVLIAVFGWLVFYASAKLRTPDEQERDDEAQLNALKEMREKTRESNRPKTTKIS